MANKPRWEAKYEKMLNQEPVSEKIAKLKEEIENTKRNEVGTFKTKEEYQEALREAKFKLPEQEAQLQDYENYEKNKTKIANILAYRKELEKQLENNPVAKEMEKNSKILEEQKKRANELMAKMQKSGIDKSEYNDLQEDLEITQAVIRNLDERNESLKTSSDNKEKEICERKIAKCNLIAANLLKGKNLEDIQIKIEPSSKTFTEAKNNEKANTNEKAGYLVNVSEFAEKHPRLAKIGEFFKNGFSSIKNRVAKVFAGKGKEKTEQSISDKEIEEVREIIRSAREAKKAEIKQSRENQLLSYIAEYGKEDGEKAFRNSLRLELEDKKKAAANEYAENYGGRYEKQDGATHKKDESEQSR